jgi:hypothetical protein
MGTIEKRVGMTRNEQKGGTFMKRRILIFALFSVIGINILSATADPDDDIIVWGWSRDGKVAVTEKLDGGATGWRITRAFIFDTVNDTVLWENRSATENLFGVAYDKAYSAFIDNFQRIRQQHAIVLQYAMEVELGRRIRGGNMITAEANGINRRYYINIDIVPRNSAVGSFPDNNIESYTVSVTSSSGRRKTILTGGRTNASNISAYRYYISPDDERVLIVLAKAVPYAMLTGGNNEYLFTGCNLMVGF